MDIDLLIKEFLYIKKSYDYYDLLNKEEYYELKNITMTKKLLSENENLFLWTFYHFIEKNYGEAKKYYLMAIDKGNSDAMVNLGYLYKKEKNYEETKKYYLMAIDKGNSDAISNLNDLKKKIILELINNDDFEIQI